VGIPRPRPWHAVRPDYNPPVEFKPCVASAHEEVRTVSPGTTHTDLDTWSYHRLVSPSLVKFDLTLVLDLHRILEATLSTELAESERRADEQEAKLGPNARRASHINGFMRFGVVLPNTARTSLFLPCYGLLESRLADLCRTWQTVMKHKLALRDINGRGIIRAQTYIEKVASLPFPAKSASWRDILRLNRVRNVLAHSEGQVATQEDRSAVWGLASAHPECLELGPDGRIRLLSEFIPYVQSVLSTFFDELYRGLR